MLVAGGASPKMPGVAVAVVAATAGAGVVKKENPVVGAVEAGGMEEPARAKPPPAAPGTAATGAAAPAGAGVVVLGATPKLKPLVVVAGTESRRKVMKGRGIFQ